MAVTGPAEKNENVWLLVALWIAHYAHRAIIFPLRIHTKGKKMPLVIMLSAIVFNIINGFLNGYFVGYLYQPENPVSIFDLNILFGLILFISGAIINNMADTKLIALRKGNNEYQVPKGWLFEYISCPNHFGEIIEWIGFALVAWNLPALSFAVWTCCNLIPRALNHHQWYSENFQEYPSQRKAVIPFVW